MKDLLISDSEIKRTSSKGETTTLSILASALLTVLKLGVGLWTGSLALIAEAAHSFLDLCSTVITYWVVKIADQPPDSNHPYGHEKAEHLGALAGMSLLGLTAVVILYHAGERVLFHPEHPIVSVWSFVVLLISLGVDFWRSVSLSKAAKIHQSHALASDAAHFTNDLWGSLAVLVGLGVVALAHVIPIPEMIVGRIDAFAAMIVAGIALYSVYHLGGEAIRALMDDVPSDLVNRLRSQVEGVNGVVPGTVVLRTRYVGKRPYVEVTLGMARATSLEAAHQLSERVEEVIASELGITQATVHVEPVEAPDESFAAKVRAVAIKGGHSIHNLSLFRLSEGLCIELDLEVSDRLTVEESSGLSEKLEKALLKELPKETVVHVHLEPRSDETILAVNHLESWERVEKALILLPQYGKVKVRDILMTDQGIVLNLDRSFSPETALTMAHDQMALLERELRAIIPNLLRVNIRPTL